MLMIRSLQYANRWEYGGGYRREPADLPEVLRGMPELQAQLT